MKAPCTGRQARGARDIAQSRLQQLGIPILENGIKIGGEIGLGLQGLSDFPTAGFAYPDVLFRAYLRHVARSLATCEPPSMSRHSSLPRPRSSRIEWSAAGSSAWASKNVT